MLAREQLSNDQKGGARFLKARTAGLLWADVGTGKTATTLTALVDLMASFDVRRVLVVGPKRVAERVWREEVAKWEHTKHLRVSCICGTEEERLAAMRVDADIYTLSRNNVHWLEKQIIHTEYYPEGHSKRGQPKKRTQIAAWPWDTVVLDESQSFMHQSAQRFKTMRMLRQLFDRLYLLSASPMPNQYPCLWSQFLLLDGGKRLGNVEKAFHKRWFHKEIHDGVVSLELREGAGQEIERTISDITYIMRDPQPPVPRNYVRVSLSPGEMAAYKAMQRNAVLRIAEQEITAVNAGVLYGKLLQLANGAIYHDEKHNWTLVHDRKLEALWELLEALPKPVLIGYGFCHDLERLIAKGHKTKLGRFAQIKSNKSLDAWRRGEIDYGVIHPASAGHGLNDLYVSGCENLVWFGFTNNLEFYEQLNGRITGGHRRAGRNPVLHHIVADGTIDERAMELLELKDFTQSSAKVRIAQMLKEELYGSSSPNPAAKPSVAVASTCGPFDWLSAA